MSDDDDRIQKRNPKARAATEANTAGTNTAASEVGLGAGASAASTPFVAEIAIITIATSNILIFIASIFKECFRKEKERIKLRFLEMEWGMRNEEEWWRRLCSYVCVYIAAQTVKLRAAARNWSIHQGFGMRKNRTESMLGHNWGIKK